MDIIVTTPSRLLSALNHKSDLCANLRHIVVDEADLLLSFGYEDDVKNYNNGKIASRKLKEYLPQSYQTIFTSATLSEDIGPLKEAFLRGSLVTLKLKVHNLSHNQLSKGLLNGQLIFVFNLRVGLFLEAFKIRSCIVNAEMPYNSRCHVVNEFNEGRYNYIIASDLNDVFANDSSQQNDSNDVGFKYYFSSGRRHIPTAVKVHQKKEKRKRKKWDKESGVSRGIDFHHVSNVINFDFPTAIDSYIHRVGRTARGWNKGTALSFAIPSEKQFVDEISEYINEMGSVIMPYEIRIKELESFVLRAREVLAACTRSVIREARLAEIKGEILRSKKLDSYFAKNPREKATLEQDKRLHSLSLHSPAIADVPDYMGQFILNAFTNYFYENENSNYEFSTPLPIADIALCCVSVNLLLPLVH
ncbi:unnamed protein product [Anisakis simplex]|uniref:RNA helicase n=1 Tax=Anisakis simplex TaxID=6269 RepID=A0A3P6SUM0_ANISI|nr:unnamed protein product [Anisakis simplex]